MKKLALHRFAENAENGYGWHCGESGVVRWQQHMRVIAQIPFHSLVGIIGSAATARDGFTVYAIEKTCCSSMVTRDRISTPSPVLLRHQCLHKLSRVGAIMPQQDGRTVLHKYNHLTPKLSLNTTKL